MDLGIKGKIAIVAGGSKGIGKAVALELGREGCQVVVVARAWSAINETVGQINAEGGSALGISADLSTQEGISETFRQTRETFGEAHIGIFNNDAPLRGSFDQTSDQDFLAAYNTFALPYTWFLREALPYMKRVGWGRIVTIGSMSVRMPHREHPLVLHNTGRAAALAIARSVADEVACHGITVNTIGTGSIATDKFQKFFASIAKAKNITYAEAMAEKAADIPAKRLGTPEEMAAVTAFLCSTRASFVTGQTVLVDGGRVPILS